MKTIQNIFPWIIMSAGIALRIREYIANRSLWVDEAYLAGNILGKSFTELLKPLTDSQHAPIGFLWAEKGMSLLLGSSEYALRIVPLLAGVVSVYLFWKLAQRLFSPFLATIALALFSFSDVLIRYSVELKQYSVEVCMTLIIYLISVPTSHVTRKKGTLLLAVGVISVLFSHTAILVLTAVTIVGVIIAGKNKKWQDVGIWAGLFILWTIVFALLYLSDAAQAYQNAFFVSEWPYVHLIPSGVRDVIENILGLRFMFMELLGSITSWAGLGLFVLGVFIFFKKRYTEATVLVLPFLFALIASGLEKYPYVTRVFLFAVPTFILCIVFSLGLIKNRIVVLFVALVLIVGSLVQAVIYVVYPREIEEMKPLLAYYQSNRSADDTLYVYYASQAAFRYYAPRYNLSGTPFHIGKESRDNWLNYIVDVNQVRNKKRVWFLFSHVIVTRVQDSVSINEEEYMTAYLDKVGSRVYSEKRNGSSLYLYEF